MNLRHLLLFCILLLVCSNVNAQTQSWQWIKAGGSTSDNNSNYTTAAHCTIGGCDIKSNVYAAGVVNGQNMTLDTFHSTGSYSLSGAGVSYLLFSYTCAGNMRWAKQIGGEDGDILNYGVTTDPEGNTYFAGTLIYGNYGGPIALHLGDSVLQPTGPFLVQPYVCMAKYDSLGHLIWFRHYESDSTDHSARFNYPLGLKIGSSGNIWMATVLDSNYAFNPALHTSKKGRYMVQIDPANGDIIRGYYVANNSMLNHTADLSAYWTMDEHENYYESGYLSGDFGSGGDTLILNNSSYFVNTSHNANMAYVFSLNKQGQLRFIDRDTTDDINAIAGPCNYDAQSHHFVGSMTFDTITHFAGLTTSFSNDSVMYGRSYGWVGLDTNGHGIWAKAFTSTNCNNIYSVQFMPLGDYSWGRMSDGHVVYDSHTSIQAGSGACLYNCSDFYSVIYHLNGNGDIQQSFVNDMGVIQTIPGGGDAIRSGAKDWRGNAYLGGSITNYMHTPVGNVTNTDALSGNFFIAKIGISSCICSTPGVSFILNSSGDTVRLSGTTTGQRDSIVWHYGDGTSGKGDTLRHVYTHDGTYTITAIAYNSCGRDSLTRQVTVTSACSTPGVNFTMTASGDTLRTLANTTSHADSIVWHFGDGTTALHDTALHVYAHDGTYTVTVIAYNACGRDTAVRQITVNTVGILELNKNQTQIYPNPTGSMINVEVSAPAEIGLISANGSMLWTAPKTLSQAGTYVFDLGEYATGIYYCVVQYNTGITEVLQVAKK